jgi:antitoxin component YwqK of YwqJK toxin-antitoxin module
MYKATFVDGKPVGEMLRFHPNGRQMARIVYDDKGQKGDGDLV